MTPNEKHIAILAKAIGVPTDELKNLNRFPDMYNCLPSEALTAMQALQEECDKQIEAAFDLHRTQQATIAQLREDNDYQHKIISVLESDVKELLEEVERLKAQADKDYKGYGFRNDRDMLYHECPNCNNRCNCSNGKECVCCE